MPASTIAVCTGASDLEAALQNLGDLNVIVTGREEFRARVTEVELQNLRVWAVHERVSRVGFLQIPADIVLALIAPGGPPSPPIWSGITLDKGDVLLCGPGRCLHMRTAGPSHWGAISLPAGDFAAYFAMLTGQVLTMPILAQRRGPSAANCRRLMQLHTAAIRAAGMRPHTIVDPEAAHGMEQQLIHALVKCLSACPSEDAAGPHECQDVVTRLAQLLRSQPERYANQTAFCAELGVSLGHLRRCCKQILGIGPASYAHLYLADRARRVARKRTAHRIAL